jgi:hypothetical protein
MTTAQQIVAPDCLQLHSFLTLLPQTGELDRSVAARGVAVCNTVLIA